MKMWRRLVVPLLAVALLGAACGSDDGGTTTANGASGSTGGGSALTAPTITVGSANFAESTIVAAMYADVLEHAGYKVTRKLDLGARDVYFKALENGELSLVPEFVGSLTAFLKGTGDPDPDTAVANLKKVLPKGLQVFDATPAQSANTFVVTKATADKYSLTKVSDLAGKDLTLGGPPECPQRPFCMIGLKDTYGIDFSSKFKPLDAGGPITKEALTQGKIDVALLFTTDPGIPKNGWVALEDDKHLQQAENVIPVIRDKNVDADVTRLLNAVSAKLDQTTYVGLISKVYIDGDDAEAVAKTWLTDNGFLK
ncbi:MAG: L-proline glycine betaine binding transporter protein ProX [Actinomycetia bacterium]|nr:L-proline glycine betaine binding transporter protein ProX [Actinomycetes bacterium]